MRHVLMSSMKDEGPYVLEWVAHHRVLGFDAIYVASNDSRDGTEALLQALHDARVIFYAENRVGPDDIPQHKGYEVLRARFPVDGADWLCVLDADEFLSVHTGGGRVQDLTAAAPADVDVIALNAMTFGTDDGAWRPGPVCARFTRRVPKAAGANIMVKCLTRAPGRFKGAHNHHMVGFRGDGPLRVMRADGSRFDLPKGAPLWKHLRNFPRADIRHDLAQFNHYAIKTADAFLLRQSRGRGAVAASAAAAGGNTRHTGDYFLKLAEASVKDSDILRYAPEVQAETARLLALPGVAAAQAAAETGYAALLAEIEGPGP